MREISLAVTTHGRLLVDDTGAAPPLRLLIGCHGYAQSADEMMDLLHTIPIGGSWTRVAVQALHRFYRGRTEITVASWMTSQDRDLLIADNIAYLDAAIREVAAGRPIERLVFCGFSQGVAMAFRAGLLGARKAEAVLALAGDVPPDLLADAALTFPRVLLARGTRDEWYTEPKLRADEAHLLQRGTQVETLTFDGAHEWHEDFARRAAAILETSLDTTFNHDAHEDHKDHKV
jgi:predicted esterase